MLRFIQQPQVNIKLTWEHFISKGGRLFEISLKIQSEYLQAGANFIELKGTRCLGLDELVYKKAFVTVCYEMHMGRKII